MLYYIHRKEVLTMYNRNGYKFDITQIADIENNISHNWERVSWSEDFIFKDVGSGIYKIAYCNKAKEFAYKPRLDEKYLKITNRIIPKWARSSKEEVRYNLYDTLMDVNGIEYFYDGKGKETTIKLFPDFPKMDRKNKMLMGLAACIITVNGTNGSGLTDGIHVNKFPLKKSDMDKFIEKYMKVR